MRQRYRIAAILLTALPLAAVADAVANAEPAVARATNSPSMICGQPVGVTKDTDGDQHHRFRMPNGLVEDQVVPAADFDPLTAPATRLAKFGLPPRGPDGSRPPGRFQPPPRASA